MALPQLCLAHPFLFRMSPFTQLQRTFVSDNFTLKMKALQPFETSVTICQSLWLKIFRSRTSLILLLAIVWRCETFLPFLRQLDARMKRNYTSFLQSYSETFGVLVGITVCCYMRRPAGAHLGCIIVQPTLEAITDRINWCRFWWEP